MTLLEGPAYVAGAALGAATGGPAGRGRGARARGPSVRSTTSPVTAPARGCKGHLGAAARGRVTTGLVKVVGIGATGLVAAALADRGRDDVARAGHPRRWRRGRRCREPGQPARPAPRSRPQGHRPGVPPAAARRWRRGGRPRCRRDRCRARACSARTSRARPCSATPAPTPPVRSSAPPCSGRTGRRGRLAALVVLAGLTLASEKVSLHPGHRVDPRAARARRLGPARTMTRRRFASGIAGAAGLIAVTTLLARTAGFARILVFTEAVRAGGVGGIYQSVNAIPNVMFEIAAGGILAAVAVPLIAHQLGAGQRDRADHTASVLLSWALLVLVPLAAAALAVRGADLVVARHQRPVGRARSPPRCCGSSPCRCRSTGSASSSPVCSRPTAASSRPRWRRWRRRSSCSCPTSGTARSSTARSSRRCVSDEAVRVLGWGTTLGVVVLSVPLVVPAMRTGWRWRPALRMPSDDARRIGALAGAGVIALLAQQAAVARHDVAVEAVRRQGHLHRLHRTPRPSTCCPTPCSPSRWPRAPSRPWRHAPGRGRTSRGTLARSLRAVLVLTALSVGVLIAAAPAIGAFFSLLDARRGDGATSTAALAALPATLTAYAPGLVGFGLDRPADPGPVRARPTAPTPGIAAAHRVEPGGRCCRSSCSPAGRARRRPCAGWASRRRWA